ncbi:hypothetical protein [Chryseolinea sp. H1M3-3]|uniref:hypothetical protein n=1 Tax=Chryseolinea sp. H1M3-3 TaxID=3034144 RepID=UPI0023ECA721|nr:hypothetical protein [Chryseolinea sp. H1M3-3]
MQKLILPIAFFSLVILSPFQSTSQTVKSGQNISAPKIFLVYPKNGTPFDRECGSFMQKPVEKSSIDEAASRLGEFQDLWDKDGALFMETALQEVGVPFPYREMQATLTVCDLSSVSSPLIINVKGFLSSAVNQHPLWAFPEIVFHEVMHTYVRNVYDISPLRKKYASEPPVVLNHLHEMALEKMILVKLNRGELLNWVDNRYRNLFPPVYKRAWEIVNDIEGYEAFIDELKTMPSSQSVRNTSK